MQDHQYVVRRTSAAVDWREIEPLDVAWFHPESSSHRPRTQARLMYDGNALHVAFDVHDQYVRCVHRGYQQPVCRDSCVEFFVQPAEAPGYFNFEVNCGGALLVYYITNPDLNKPGRRQVLPDESLDLIRIVHSLPDRVEPEITAPVRWQVELTLPWSFFTSVLSLSIPEPGTVWRANFYKCADDSSHPHWASWSPVPGSLNFHRPECFGTLRFSG